jgi:hypothetical protein
MWVYVGDPENPYNVFDFTLNRGRDGPQQFLQEYKQVLLADACGGYNGVVAGNDITRAGCWRAGNSSRRRNRRRRLRARRWIYCAPYLRWKSRRKNFLCPTV